MLRDSTDLVGEKPSKSSKSGDLVGSAAAPCSGTRPRTGAFFLRLKPKRTIASRKTSQPLPKVFWSAIGMAKWFGMDLFFQYISKLSWER